MPSSDKTDVHFSAQMKQKFEEFAVWAIENYPDRTYPISDKDFNHCRQQIAQLADRRHEDDKQNINEQNKAIPEPSESGPQYVNVTPNPWP